MSTDPYGSTPYGPVGGVAAGAAGGPVGGYGAASGGERLDLVEDDVRSPGTDDLSVTHRPDPGGRASHDDGTDVADVSLGTLVGNLTGDLSRLMRAELALAKAEAKEEAAAAGKGAGMLAGAGVGGHLVLVFASLALMFALGGLMPIGWAALVVAVLWAVVAAVLASAGRKNLQRATPPLPETVETLKEDAQWAKRPRG